MAKPRPLQKPDYGSTSLAKLGSLRETALRPKPVIPSGIATAARTVAWALARLIWAANVFIHVGKLARKVEIRRTPRPFATASCGLNDKNAKMDRFGSTTPHLGRLASVLGQL
jgi:hypothetical protein